MNKEFNAGYEIIKTEIVGSKKFALGYNPRAPQPYVTWKCKTADNDYYHGHYFTNENKALKDFDKRVKAEREPER